MSGWGVRAAALLEAAMVAERIGEEVWGVSRRLAGALAGARVPVLGGGVDVLRGWAHAQALGIQATGPGGLVRDVASLRSLAVGLRTASRCYEEVEAGVAATMRTVAVGADLAAGAGVLTDGLLMPRLRAVAPSPVPERLSGPSDLVALGGGLVDGRVRVVELAGGPTGSSWVVVVPGTQQWSPRAGPNPFDLSTDVRALVGDPTAAAAGVAAALEVARRRAGRADQPDPVLLVGHSQGGILAAALAGDPGFTRRNHVTHVVTSGAPVGLFPVPREVMVLSVEHAADPVPALDLTPNPVRPSWVTLRTSGTVPALDPRAHRLEGYVSTLAAAESAPRGALPGVAGVVGWRAGAGAFLGPPVRSSSEFEIERGWQNPRS